MSATRPRPLVLGAVASDPQVVTVWETFKRYFTQRGLPFEYVLYSTYEQQVLSHFDGHCHVALNSPLAWIETERLAFARGRKASAIVMRDIDRDLCSVIVSRLDGAIASVADLKGQRLAVGANDSPQATLIPLEAIAQAGLVPGRDIEVIHNNVSLGKHGAHIASERDAVLGLMSGKVDACCLLNAHRSLFAREGILPADATRVVATTEPFDMCNVTVLDGAPQAQIERFVALLLAISGSDTQARWLPGRLSGYVALNRAVDRFRTLDWLFACE